MADGDGQGGTILAERVAIAPLAPPSQLPAVVGAKTETPKTETPKTETPQAPAVATKTEPPAFEPSDPTVDKAKQGIDLAVYAIMRLVLPLGALVFGGLELIAPEVITSVNLEPATASLLFTFGAGYYGMVLNGAKR